MADPPSHPVSLGATLAILHIQVLTYLVVWTSERSHRGEQKVGFALAFAITLALLLTLHLVALRRTERARDQIAVVVTGILLAAGGLGWAALAWAIW